jgi:hypothetical protein
MKSQILSLIFMLTVVTQCLGQPASRNVSKSGTAAATFLEIGVGARATAMGGAFVSLANDATALYWNVAGVAKAERNEVVALHTKWLAGTSFDFVGLVLASASRQNIFNNKSGTSRPQLSPSISARRFAPNFSAA